MSPLGRPRNQASHTAVLKAALRLVTKNGFRAVRVDQIAAEAKVGKMTIYRHWPNKAALVMDSLLQLIGNETAFPEEGAALQRLRQQLVLQAEFFCSGRGTLIRSLIAEAQNDMQLAQAFRDQWLNPRREEVRNIMRTAITEGSLRIDTDIDVAIDMLYGALYYRLLLRSGPLDSGFVEQSFKQFLNGLAPE